MTEKEKTEAVELSPYQILRAIDVNAHVEKKNGLSYLSWVWALDQLYMLYPESSWRVNKTADGIPYWTDGRTCWVDVEVFVAQNGEILMSRREPAFPIMDYRNKSIPLEAVTSMDVNTAIQRAVTKAVARCGLGFYLYAGEDINFTDKEKQDASALKKFEAVNADLIALGVDRHDPAFVSWIGKTAGMNIKSLNPTDFMGDPDAFNKIISAMRKAVKAKAKEKENAEEGIYSRAESY